MGTAIFKKDLLRQADFGLLMAVLFLMPVAGALRLAEKPVQISDILFLVYFIAWAFKKIIIRDFRLNFKFYLFCSFLIILCLSVFFSPFTNRSAVGLIIKIYLLMLAYVISEEVNSPQRLKYALNTILLSGIYVIFLSFWGTMSFLRRMPSGFLCPNAILDLPLTFLPRVQGSFSSPSFLSSFLAIITLLLLREIAYSGSALKNKFRYLIYFIFSATVFLFTFSRDLIGLGWGLIFLLQLRYKGQKRHTAILTYSKVAMILITFFVLVISIWYIFPVKIYKTAPNITLPAEGVQFKIGGGELISQMGWISEKFISFNAKLHNRAMELRDAMQTFIRNPIFGIGVGVLPSQGYFSQPYSRSSHNTYLQVLAQTGIPGFIVFLVFIISLFRILRTQAETTRSDNIKVIFQTMLLVFLINMLFTDLDNFRYFWIIAGLIFSLDNPNMKNA